MNLKTVIERATGYYMVSTVDTRDAGLETLVFPCTKDGEITDYGELAGERYSTEHEAREGHFRMTKLFFHNPNRT